MKNNIHKTILAVLAVVAIALLGGCSTEEEGANPEAAASAPTAVAVAAPAPDAVEAEPLLRIEDTRHDGDSFTANDGVEYRLYAANAPESDECFGPEATERVRSLLADGFTVRPIEADRYGRTVAVITTANGRDLAVVLMRQGYANDRYTAQYRQQDPEASDRAQAAYDEAVMAQRGVHDPQACAPAPAPAGDECHPNYLPCLPITGDLNCPDVPGPVTVIGGQDPYGLDGDGDGFGCTTS